MKPPGLTIARLRTNAAVREPVVARLAAEALAAEVLAAPPLPPQAVLLLRRLSLAVPRHALERMPDARLRSRVASAARAAIGDAAARAARPALVPDLTEADAVWFGDESELLACLARDALRGHLDRWWWRQWLGQRYPDWISAWTERAAMAPAALRLAARAGLLAPLLVQLRLYGVPAQAWLPRDAYPAAAPGAAAGTVQGRPEGRFTARATTAGPGLHGARTGVANAPEPAHPGTDEAAIIGPAAAPSHSVPGRANRGAAPTGQPGSAHPGAAAAPAGRLARAARAIPAAMPEPDEPGPLSRTSAVPGEAWRAAAAPPSGPEQPQRKAAPPVPAAAVLPASCPANATQMEREAAAILASTPTRAHGPRTRGAAAPFAPARSPQPAHGISAALGAAPAMALDAAPHVLITRHGRLLFLVNVLLGDGLYPDFTRPLDPAFPLPIWRLLMLIGLRLAGPALRGDALWGVLDRLAEAAPPSGASFDPRDLDRHWPVPCAAQRGRARGQLDGWLARYVSSLRARLSPALGVKPALVGPAFAGSEARLWVSEAELVLVTPLPAHPVAWRLAGLDRDPGPLPGAGRTLRFVFE